MQLAAADVSEPFARQANGALFLSTPKFTRLYVAGDREAIAELDLCVDAVLIDISNTECSGLESFARLQELNKSQCIVVQSVHAEHQVALGFIRNGAQDYIVRGSEIEESLALRLHYGSERNRVALDQRLREERMKLVLEDSYDAFISMDARLEITDWNKQAERTFGWTG
ncbi:MAG: PAS domain S-box protein [Candidatus Melainabacteria bacterium]|nr:PAS domain S-box protein [Candidatus Melainabacteria bacterium]